MAKYRKNRINDAMTAECAQIVREIKDPRVSGIMITVMNSDVSADLKFAKIYYSVLGEMRSRKAWNAMNGIESKVSPSSTYKGFIFVNIGLRTMSSSPSTADSATPARLLNMSGRKAKRTISGTHMISHHLNLPEYRQMHNEATETNTRQAVNGDAVRVRMNSRIAIPMMKISHPESPSL